MRWTRKRRLWLKVDNRLFLVSCLCRFLNVYIDNFDWSRKLYNSSGKAGLWELRAILCVLVYCLSTTHKHMLILVVINLHLPLDFIHEPSCLKLYICLRYIPLNSNYTFMQDQFSWYHYYFCIMIFQETTNFFQVLQPPHISFSVVASGLLRLRRCHHNNICATIHQVRLMTYYLLILLYAHFLMGTKGKESTHPCLKHFILHWNAPQWLLIILSDDCWQYVRFIIIRGSLPPMINCFSTFIISSFSTQSNICV